MFKYRNLINTIIISVFLVLISIGIITKIHLHPNNKLLGSWKEIEWHYVKANDITKKGLQDKIIIDEVLREKISKHLLIHKSEKWEFYKNGHLIIHKFNVDDIHAKWVLKGRGTILKIIYENDIVELYQIKKVNKTTMVLQFENDIHVKGIVRIEFKKY